MKVGGGTRGVSTVLSVLILMAIVLVGSVLVYQIFLRNAAAQDSNGQVSVQGASLLMATSGKNGTALFSITIENSGNKPVTAVELTVDDVAQVPASCPPPAPPAPPQSPTFCVMSASISSSNALAPDQVTSATGTPSAGGGGSLLNFLEDASYPYTVQVTFTDSSTYIVAGSVVASQA
jgi:hypothetical protein